MTLPNDKKSPPRSSGWEKASPQHAHHPGDEGHLHPELAALLRCCSPCGESKAEDLTAFFSLPGFSADEFCRLAKLYSLAPLTGSCLKELAIPGIAVNQDQPETAQRLTLARKVLEKSRLAALLSNTRLKEETESILNLLRERGIRVMSLKGVELAESVFGGLDRRVIGDIDILVDSERLDESLAELYHRGYEPPNRKLIHHERSQSHHIKLRHPESGILLELHWHLVQPDRFPLFAKKFRDTPELWTETDVGTRLSPLGFWLSLVIHHHEHAYGEFKTLLDLAWTMRLKPLDRNPGEAARAYGLEACWAVIIEQFSMYLPEMVSFLPATDGCPRWFQRIARGRLRSIPAIPGRDLYRRKLFARLLQPDPRQILRSALIAMLPPQETIAHRGRFSRFKDLVSFFSRLRSKR